MTISEHWQQRVGSQRDWVWRGWQTRYTYVRSLQKTSTPLILLHGFGTSIGHWRNNLTVLGASHTVYALDMLGFGASEKPAINYNVELWVEQVYDFWRTFINTPVVLVGNSTGSLVTLTLAATYPEMVAGIAMLSLPDLSVREEAVPKFLRPIVSNLESLVASKLLFKTVFRVVNRPGIVKKWAAMAYSNPAAVTDELVDILLAPAQDRGSANAFAGILKAMVGAGFAPRVRNVLPSLKVPILLIWGQQDRMVPHSFARQFADYNPQYAQLVSLENVGHCPHDECPDVVNQALLDWISGFSKAGGGSLSLGDFCS